MQDSAPSLNPPTDVSDEGVADLQAGAPALPNPFAGLRNTPKKGLKIYLRKHLRAVNLLVSSRSISPLGEIGGYGATDNCSPRWAQD